MPITDYHILDVSGHDVTFPAINSTVSYADKISSWMYFLFHTVCKLGRYAKFYRMNNKIYKFCANKTYMFFEEEEGKCLFMGLPIEIDDDVKGIEIIYE